MERLIVLSLLLVFSAAATVPHKFTRKFTRTHFSNLNPKSDNGHYKHFYQDYYEEGVMIGSQFYIGYWILDTASVNMTVAACPLNNTDAENAKLNCFDPRKSKSYRGIDQSTGIDYIMPFSDTYVNMTQAFTLIPYGDVDHHMNGVLGMNWPVGDLAYTPFSTNMLRHCDKNMFTLAFSITGCQSFLEFGDLLPGPQCDNSKIHYVPLTSKASWQFAMNGFEFGSISSFAKSQAVVASATGYIGLPGQYLKKMMTLADIPWNATVGAYVTACNRTDLPDFRFLVDGATLTVPPTQYLYRQLPLLPYGSNRCVVNFEDSGSSGFGPEWYFGHPLMGSYCVNFDFDGVRIGFSPNSIDTQANCLGE
uniref:Peptidase A1 domain-containing protein n=1 Tax=Steinernema glaseri TaxID=37863 RepID=A0A1I8AB23_9BILA